MGKRYGQFCPVAMAAEVLCERWVPLVLREVMYGSTRFSDIARGVPLMSRALLAQRLRELEASGIVEKAAAGYRLTPSGEALRPIIEEMGLWAQHWLKRDLDERDLDDKLLMWGLRRMLRLPPQLGRRVLLRFDFYGLPRGARVARRSWWLLANRPDEVEICLKDPGYETDVVVAADLRAFTEVILGRKALARALREGCVKLQGHPALVRALPRWLPLHSPQEERSDELSEQR
jgi:DNA-binding HxlR family transcriptional regulator